MNFKQNTIFIILFFSLKAEYEMTNYYLLVSLNGESKKNSEKYYVKTIMDAYIKF